MYQSPSSVLLYLSCPTKYRIHYIDRQPPLIVDDTHLKVGKSIHKILQHFYANIDIGITEPDQVFPEVLKKVAFEHWDRTIDARKREAMEEAIFKWVSYEIQRFKNYKKQNFLDRFKPIAVEQEIKDHEKGLHCIIDKVCLGLTGTYALDYKTDVSLPPKRTYSGKLQDVDVKFKVQAGINAICLQSSQTPIQNFYFQFIRYPENLLSVPLIPELFVEVGSYLQQIKLAEATNNFPKNKKSCFFCDYKVYCKTEESTIFCSEGGII